MLTQSGDLVCEAGRYFGWQGSVIPVPHVTFALVGPGTPTRLTTDMRVCFPRRSHRHNDRSGVKFKPIHGG